MSDSDIAALLRFCAAHLDKRTPEAPVANPVEQFIADECHAIPGAAVTFADFYTRFVASRPGEKWSKVLVSPSLPLAHPCGAMTGNKKYVANLAFDQVAPSVPLVKVEHRLERRCGR